MTATVPRIGLAISGGGFRAMAFGLGALRALHDRDLLSSVRVISGISGGAILSALWAYGPMAFEEFDLGIRQMLRNGIQFELAQRAFSPASIYRSAAATVSGVATGSPRVFSRTEALVGALRDRGLDLPMKAVTHPDLDVVLSATDLSTGNAVRFGSLVSSSSPLGRIVDEVPVADAAAASASFPLLLPALVRSYEFERGDGSRHVARLAMTDGGVYDNLGTTPLLPGRSREHTSHVYDLDALVVVDAGRGRYERRPGGHWVSRTKQTFEISHGRVQDAARTQLHALNGIRVVHVYLGSQDDRLPFVPDLVPRDPISAYGTNFAAMPPLTLERLSVRAEQITRVLMTNYL
jgi:NTE family protein